MLSLESQDKKNKIMFFDKKKCTKYSPYYAGITIVNRSIVWINGHKNDERIDPPLLDDNHNTSENMKDRIKIQRFCHFFQLRNNCIYQGCKLRYGPKLSPQEMAVLRIQVTWLPCEAGSRPRQRECMFGDDCHNQPGCTSSTIEME